MMSSGTRILMLLVACGTFTLLSVKSWHSAYGQEEAAQTAIDENAVAPSPAEATTDAASEAVKTPPKTTQPEAKTSEVLPEPALPENAEISNGERFSIDGKGFTISAPKGWVVQKNFPRASLFLQARVPAGIYPANISVLRFKDSVFINNATADAFAEKLVRQFPAVSPTIERYTLRNHQSVQMADGRDGILFYTDFEDSGKKMMQAHVLVSSETNHYLATYTDLAENFENPSGSNDIFNQAWWSMTSIELDSPNPVQSNDIQNIILAVLGVVALVGTVALVRGRLAARMYRRYGNLEESNVSEKKGGKKTKSKSSEQDFEDDATDMEVLADNKEDNDDDEDDHEELEDVDADLSDGGEEEVVSTKPRKLLAFRKKNKEELYDEEVDDLVDYKEEDEAHVKEVSSDLKKLKKGA